jgi:hypothetical protein
MSLFKSSNSEKVNKFFNIEKKNENNKLRDSVFNPKYMKNFSKLPEEDQKYIKNIFGDSHGIENVKMDVKHNEYKIEL